MQSHVMWGARTWRCCRDMHAACCSRYFISIGEGRGQGAPRGAAGASIVTHAESQISGYHGTSLGTGRGAARGTIVIPPRDRHGTSMVPHCCAPRGPLGGPEQESVHGVEGPRLLPGQGPERGGGLLSGFDEMIICEYASPSCFGGPRQERLRHEWCFDRPRQERLRHEGTRSPDVWRWVACGEVRCAPAESVGAGLGQQDELRIRVLRFPGFESHLALVVAIAVVFESHPTLVVGEALYDYVPRVAGRAHTPVYSGWGL